MGNLQNINNVRKNVKTKRDLQFEKYIPIFDSILEECNPEGIDFIIRKDVAGLVSLLNKREVSSLQLVAIYGYRAATIGRSLSCITEECFEYAIQRAKECD
jgi:hypothetical protein